MKRRVTVRIIRMSIEQRKAKKSDQCKWALSKGSEWKMNRGWWKGWWIGWWKRWWKRWLKMKICGHPDQLACHRLPVQCQLCANFSQWQFLCPAEIMPCHSGLERNWRNIRTEVHRYCVCITVIFGHIHIKGLSKLRKSCKCIFVIMYCMQLHLLCKRWDPMYK